jgi:hypothetical protein
VELGSEEKQSAIVHRILAVAEISRWKFIEKQEQNCRLSRCILENSQKLKAKRAGSRVQAWGGGKKGESWSLL